MHLSDISRYSIEERREYYANQLGVYDMPVEEGKWLLDECHALAMNFMLTELLFPNS